MRIIVLLLAILIGYSNSSTGQTEEVCFMDAGAGIVRFDIIENEYSFACFSDIFFPHDVVYDPVGNWVYWTAWTTDRIYKCRPDGTEVDDPIQGVSHVRGIEIDTQKNLMYWVENLDDEVMKYNILLDYSTVLVSGIENPMDVVLDAAHNRLFVAAREGIYSVRENGTNLTLILDKPGIKAIEYDPQSGLIYYASHTERAIVRMTDMGTNLETIATVTGLPDGLSIDGVNQWIYWTDWEAGSVTRARLDGASRSTVISSNGNISGVFVDPGTNQLFWLDQDLSEVHRAGLWGQQDTTIIEGETWKWISDFQVSLADDKLFVINDFTDQIVRTDRNGYHPEVIVDSVPGATRIAYDQYSQKLYWSDYFEQCIYVKDLRKNTTRRIVENVHVISMAIDYNRFVLCFVDQLTKSLKTYALFAPVVKTIPTPIGTEPKALGVQSDPRFLFWIDNVNEDVYRHVLGTSEHAIAFDEDGESITSIGPGIGNQERFYIHDYRVKYGNPETMSSDWLYYPGTVFISDVKATNDFVPMSIIPRYDIDTLIVCKEDLASVRLDVYGAIPPVSYAWSDGYVSDYYHRTNILPATYQVTVTDARDSAVVMQIALSPPQGFVEASLITENAEGGNNGTASTTISGGLPPYTMVWTGNGIEINDQLMIDQLAPGEYHLRVADANGCETDTTFSIELKTSVKEVVSGFRLTPNPATDYLTLDTDSDFSEVVTYQLMDTHSKTKEQGKIGSGEKLDISFLVPGVYLMKLTSTQGVFGHSFIKL
jgi:hypothetical protein